MYFRNQLFESAKKLQFFVANYPFGLI